MVAENRLPNMSLDELLEPQGPPEQDSGEAPRQAARR
jgi:hypothetical protein